MATKKTTTTTKRAAKSASAQAGAKSAKGKGDKAKSDKPAPAKLSRFGARADTAAGRVHSALSKRPKSMDELSAAAGIHWPPRNILKALIDAGHVVKTDDGKYKLA